MFLLFSTFFLSRSGLCRLNTVLLLALLSGCAALPASDIAAPAAPSPSLRNEFRRAYDGAIEQHRAAVILASPVVIGRWAPPGGARPLEGSNLLYYTQRRKSNQYT